MESDELPVKPDTLCAHCGHKIVLKGDVNTSQYWECERNCRCMMIGCTPVLGGSH